MRWLIVLPFDRPEHMGVDFRDELQAMGHEVRTFAYRRNNPLYKNRGTKAAYQVWILRRLERLCVEWRPSLVLVIKGGPITPGLVRRVKRRLDILFRRRVEVLIEGMMRMDSSQPTVRVDGRIEW